MDIYAPHARVEPLHQGYRLVRRPFRKGQKALLIGPFEAEAAKLAWTKKEQILVGF